MVKRSGIDTPIERIVHQADTPVCSQEVFLRSARALRLFRFCLLCSTSVAADRGCSRPKTRDVALQSLDGGPSWLALEKNRHESNGYDGPPIAVRGFGRRHGHESPSVRRYWQVLPVRLPGRSPTPRGSGLRL